MRKLFLLLSLAGILAGILSAQTYTEFYTDNSATGCGGSGCSNLNAGSSTAAPVLAVTGRTWTASARTLLVASTTGVSTGMFMSVFPDGTTPDALYICRISTVTLNTALVCAASPVVGTAPVDGVSNRSARVGGAWLGPNAADGFPFTMAGTGGLVDVATDPVRINIKAGTTYAITAAITTSATYNLLGMTQGFTSSPGDGGKAIFDGGSPGTAYIMLTISCTSCAWADLIFQNNGTGAIDGVAASGARLPLTRLVVSGMGGNGLTFSGSGIAVELEAFGNNTSNTAATGGFKASVATTWIRPNAHDNSGSNTSGMVVSTSSVAVALISPLLESNGSCGVSYTGSNVFVVIEGGVFYNNGASGICAPGSGTIFISNAAFAKNVTYGIDLSAGTVLLGSFQNLAFGSGTYANGGQISATGGKQIQLIGNVTLSSNVSPWIAPATGNFQVANAGGNYAGGRYQYTQTGSGKSGTVGYPDIGVGGQHQCVASGGPYGYPNGQ